MWIRSVFCRAELKLHWMTDLSTFPHNPLFFTLSAVLCVFFLPFHLCFPDIHLDMFLSRLRFCTFCLLRLFLSFPSWTLVFYSAGIGARNAVSLLHLHLHLSGKQTGYAVGIYWQCTGDFTPTEQISSLMPCSFSVIKWFIVIHPPHLNEWLKG